jgi:cell division protein FtsQ
VDEQGTVLAAFKTLKQLSVPIITGIKLGNIYVGDQVDNPEVRATLAYLALLSENSLNQLSEVNVSDPAQIRALTVNSIQIRLGNQAQLSEKAAMTNQMINEIGDKKGLVEFIDLRYATPYIKFK